ncbi:MAG TPA: rhomboid family intramembrane serine protease, partial [Pyrinomonadaceae bacterium]|nr:rhomboid family intramembrane serine protease [Pyrinomonadaceae bacterium]
ARPAEQQQRPPRAPHADPETLRFLRAIISRPATFTFVFLTACVFLYLLMEFSGGAQGAVLIEYGAKVNRLIDERGEWWRFVTPIFLHVTVPGYGPLHLLTNMYGLFMLGPYVEKLYGSPKFVFFWMLTGVAGVATSYLTVRPALAGGPWGYIFKARDYPAAGASGALFGLVGVLFVFGIKYRKELPEDFKRAFGFGMLPMILLNLLIGYLARGVVDNAAHLGGLLAGVVLALFVSYKRPGEPTRRAALWRLAQVALLALVAASFAAAWRNFGGPRPDAGRFSLRELFSLAGPSRYLGAINESESAFHAALNGDPEPAERVVRQLDEAPPLDDREKLLRGELKAILVSAQQYGSTKLEERKKASAQRQREQLVTTYDEWNKRFLEWVKTEGGNYGIIMREGEEAAPERKDAPESKK